MDQTTPMINQMKFNSSISLWLQQANQQNIENLKKFQEQNFEILQKYSKGENNKSSREQNSQSFKNIKKMQNKRSQKTIGTIQTPKNLEPQEIIQQLKNEDQLKMDNFEQQQTFQSQEEPAIWLQLENIENPKEESKENKQQFGSMQPKLIESVKNQKQALLNQDKIKTNQDLKDYMRLEVEINQQLQFVRSKIDELKKSFYE